MKTFKISLFPPFPALPPLWSSFPCVLALAAATLFCPAITWAQTPVLITGFEKGEGFEAGRIDGQEGWETNVGTDQATIVDDDAYEGTQSLRIAGGNNDWAGSPPLTREGYTGISFWMSNPDAIPAPNARLFRFHISLGEANGDADTPQRVLQFVIVYGSSPDGSRYSMTYDAWEDGAHQAGQQTSFLKTFLVADGWTEFRFETDPGTQTYSVSIGNTPVLSAIPLGGTVTGNSSIRRVQFRSHGDLSGASRYDNVTGYKAAP